MSWEIGSFWLDPRKTDGEWIGNVEFIDESGTVLDRVPLTWNAELQSAIAKMGSAPHRRRIARADFIRDTYRRPIPFRSNAMMPIAVEAGNSFEIRCDITGRPPFTD